MVLAGWVARDALSFLGWFFIQGTFTTQMRHAEQTGLKLKDAIFKDIVEPE